MKLKAFGIGAALAAVVTGSVGFAQQAAATANPAPCPAEGFSGNFSHGWPRVLRGTRSRREGVLLAALCRSYASGDSIRSRRPEGRWQPECKI